MLYTSAQAGKLVRKLEEEIKNVLEIEAKSATFHAAHGENLELNRPVYNFASTQAELSSLREKVRKVKHAINRFNVV